MTRYIYGFLFLILFICFMYSVKMAMNKSIEKKCENSESFENISNKDYKKKLIKKFIIDYKKELKRFYDISKDEEDKFEKIEEIIFNQLNRTKPDLLDKDKFTFDLDIIIQNTQLNLKQFLLDNNAGKINNTLNEYDKFFELFNRYTESCLVVDKEMVLECSVLRHEILDDLVDVYFENNKDSINFYSNKKTDVFKSELKNFLKTNEELVKDINLLNDKEKFKTLLKNEYEDKYDDKLLDIISKMELRYNKNLGQLVKKIDMGVFMKPLSMIDTKYDILEKSNLGFGILCFYCFIGYIVPFLPFVYAKEESKNGAYWKVILMTVIISGVLVLLYVLSLQSPNSNDIKEKELEYLYEV